MPIRDTPEGCLNTYMGEKSKQAETVQVLSRLLCFFSTNTSDDTVIWLHALFDNEYRGFIVTILVQVLH